MPKTGARITGHEASVPGCQLQGRVEGLFSLNLAYMARVHVCDLLANFKLDFPAHRRPSIQAGLLRHVAHAGIQGKTQVQGCL